MTFTSIERASGVADARTGYEFDAESTYADEDSVHMDTICNNTREITFRDETPVIEALVNEIQTQVAHLYEEFNACLVEEYALDQDRSHQGDQGVEKMNGGPNSWCE